MTNKIRAATRTHRGWAISVLQEVNAIHECEDHGWVRDRADPHARDHAVDIARQHPPVGLSPDARSLQRRQLTVGCGRFPNQSLFALAAEKLQGHLDALTLQSSREQMASCVVV